MCIRDRLRGALLAAEANLIDPFLIGPEAKIRAVAEENGFDLGSHRIVNVKHSHDAAAMAVTLVRSGDVGALMKGSLHTDELMAEVISRAAGLRTERRISHVFLMDVPTYPRPIMITDAAINILPTLEEKVDIIQNAIDLAHIIGTPEPKVAILSAVETVNPKIQSTLDAAALCKMADRGQIKGGLLDGPLAFDNAVSLVAAKTKGITSAVAGRADILVVPDLESGNMIAKQLEYLANALSAGIVPVSYTHLDVYKRQAQGSFRYAVPQLSPTIGARADPGQREVGKPCRGNARRRSSDVPLPSRLLHPLPYHFVVHCSIMINGVTIPATTF